MTSTKLATTTLIAASLLFAGPAMAQSQATPTQATPDAPVAGRAVLGVAVVEMDAVIAGWSVKNDMLRKNVVNDKKEKIGTISDIIIAPRPDGKPPVPSFAIIGVGGFLGLARHDVAIPMEQIKLQDGNLVLAGATKDALKALPPFEYRKK
jgi:hypothetical protein